MPKHMSGCLICGRPLVYFEDAQELPCAFCGKTFSANASCEDGHYICDACHMEKALDVITQACLETQSADPIAISRKIMRDPFVHMHGPEHHYLVPAVLLAAYKNAGGSIDLEKCLRTARERTQDIPGGICGFLGCCGAGVGAGVFASIVSGATPLSGAEWGIANLATSRALEAIAENGGPRCCKRDVFLSLSCMAPFSKKYFGVELSMPEKLKCSFFGSNPDCSKENCLYYPL
ncbi:MAG: DUF5714 domain-containing protein [Christensenellaceae bacterium]|jgi:hypothetical protein